MTLHPLVVCGCFVLAAVVPARAAEPFTWQMATPESQGMSSARLEALKESLAARNTRAFLVVRNDKIVFEWYAAGQGPTTKQGTASLAKALVGGLALAVALTDGRIALDDPVARYVPQWRADPQKAKITIRHLGSHTSGMEDSSVPGIAHPNEPGWKGEFWKRAEPPNDAFSISRDQTPLLFEPGKAFQYSNPGIAVLSYAITASLRTAPQKDLRTLLRDRIMRPIGVPDSEWSIGYGKTWTVDGLPLVASWGGGSYTPRAAARLGRLVLHEGDWDGTRLLSNDAIRQVTTSAGLPEACGMGWWTNAAQRHPRVPQDAVWGAGAGDQVLLVIPSLKLIMVRNGGNLAPVPKGTEKGAQSADPSAEPRARFLFEPLVEAVNASPEGTARAEERAPYPPSRVLTRLDWAAKETIVRKAKGSDNWPLTWADDGYLYTAYGDGNGFEPFLREKLSLGLARVEGGPTAFAGFNIRSPTGEHKGDGPKGKKASGMLMVDGVLYLLVRNAGNAQLGWSEDHGRTWAWADWKFATSFGCPTFLNFGQNQRGARDAYAYIYSHDADSAYQAADRMVLARVSRARIKERDAYEFFKGLDAQGQPLWTRDVGKRGAVFTHPGRCYRSGISYNAALQRYLWCQILPGKEPRFAGGFGVYDAPEPWGPWTTVFYTTAWDVGPGETSSFPTKWMGQDGRTLFLVFSGDDCFSVRQATLTVAPGPTPDSAR